MKSGVYLFTGCIISVLVIKTNEDLMNAICETWGSDERKYLCAKSVANQDGYIILPDAIPSNVEELLLLKGDSSTPWIINSVDYFLRYPELHNLAIGGIVKFSQDLFDTEAKSRELQGKLFDLAKLMEFSCLGCEFNSRNHMWKIPWEITRLVLSNNSYEEYTFSYSPYLTELNLEWNSLKKMPQWYDKASPLRQLYLYGNPDLQITFEDVVKYCDLTEMSFNVEGSLITKSEQSCDCFRIKKWIKDFDIKLVKGSDVFGGGKPLTLNCAKVVRCEKHQTEEYLKNKEICVMKRKLKENPAKHKPPFKASRRLLRSVFILTFVTFCLVAGAVLLYAKHKSRRRRRKHKKRIEDDQ